MSGIIRHIKNKWWMYTLCLFTMIALLHKFIANDLPIIAKSERGISCPVCQEYLYEIGWVNKNPRNRQYQSVVNPPISFSPYAISYEDTNLAPLQGAHLLGTDNLGRDLLSGLIHGAWKAFIVGVFAIGIAFLIALIVGGVAGYCKGEIYQDSIMGISLKALFFILSLFYLITEWQANNFWKGLLFFIVIMVGVIFILNKLPKGKKIIKVKPDVWADKIIEIREVIPGIFLVLASLSLFSTASIWNVVLVIGFISWSNMARFIRAEFLRVKSQNYYLAARSLGLTDRQLILKHILPNALDPILATVAFAISSAILIEASLSFLGIGVPPEEITWGVLLAEARKTNAWWLALFPGICIFLVLISLQAAADKWRRKYR